MNILIIADALKIGGAEWFLLRQADYLQQHDHNIKVVVTRPDYMDKSLLQRFAHLDIVYPNINSIKIAVQADRINNKIFAKEIALNHIARRFLQKLISHFKPEVLHSHLLSADYKVFLANKKFKIRHIITNHGDYVEFIKNNNKRRFTEMADVLSNCNSIVTITSEQDAILKNFIPEIKDKIYKIYNGYAINELPNAQKATGFNYGMIARGIEKKGWKYLIESFLNANLHSANLFLYGNSDFLTSLSVKYNDYKAIKFKGYSDNPISAVAGMDVGLFTSYHESESLPTTIIEYLMLGKPVITTDVGECREMIRVGDEYAGEVIPLKNGLPDVEAFANAMQKMQNDKAYYKHCSQLALKAAEKFSMDLCMDKYMQLYNGR